ncbi:MAG TPA: hypothetical protein VKA15_07960, partial [Isosphaeraceae bacterium]|nr:hypothetical protein [Isosphaeraceae bacterium]
VFYEGRPADYYVARIDSLAHERKDVVEEFEALVQKDLKAVNTSLAARKMDVVQPITREAWEKANADAEGGGAQSGQQRLRQILDSR